MHRFQRISTSVATLNAQLFEHEGVIVDKEGVGLYDGKEKTVAFDNGRMYLTTHRLIYIDNAHPHRNSRYLDLSLVKQTEHWAGFLKSSAKITLVLGDPLGGFGSGEQDPTLPSHSDIQQNPAASASLPYDDESLHPSAQSWGCHVCGFRNLVTSGSRCGLCGVIRPADSPSPSPSSSASARASPNITASTPSPHRLSIGSIPSSGTATPILDPNVTDALISCPSCTFLNHPSMVRCEICDSPLGTATLPSSRPSRVATPTSSNRPGTPSATTGSTNGGGTSSPMFVRLSFRKGGDKPFYAALKKALQAKEWDVDRRSKSRRAAEDLVADSANPENHRTATFGIDGILRTIDLDARDKEDDMQEALSDLEILMARAKEMVSLAQSLNTKVLETKAGKTVVEGDTEDQASTVVWQSLTSLGLQAPAVTPEMVADEREYHLQLAKELGSVLLGTGRGKTSVPVMQDGPKAMIGLDEIWCIWNRARGVALVSPKDLKQACDHLPLVTRPPIRLRTFKSGLTVLHLPHFGEHAFTARMQELLDPSKNNADDVAGSSGGRNDTVPSASTLDVAREEGLSVILAQRMLELLEEESKSILVRDEGDTRQGTLWQHNYFEILEQQWTYP